MYRQTAVSCPPVSAGEPFLSLAHTCAPFLAPEHPSWLNRQGLRPPTLTPPGTPCCWQAMGKGTPNWGSAAPSLMPSPPCTVSPLPTPPAPHHGMLGRDVCSANLQVSPSRCLSLVPGLAAGVTLPQLSRVFRGARWFAGDHTPPDRQRVSRRLEPDTAHDRVTVLRAPSLTGAKYGPFPFASFSPQTHHDL